MSKTKSVGYTDTPVAGVTELAFPRQVLNFNKDYRAKTDSSSKEIVLVNLTSPLDRPEKIRIAHSDIANVYSNSGIDASLSAPTKRGVSILCQETNVVSITDATDPDYRIDLPVSYHLVIKVPASEFISATEVQEGLGRLLSSLFDTGSDELSRLEAILRGSLEPADL